MDTEHLIKRNGWYWVQVAVPAKLRPILGKPVLRQCLHTRDTRTAVEEKGQHVTKFLRMIRAAKSGKSLPSMPVDDVERQALALRDWEHPDKFLIVGGMAEEFAIDDPKGPAPDEVYGEGELGQIAGDFYEVAMRLKTPLTAFLDAFIAGYKGRAPHTVTTRRKDVLRFERWLRKTGKTPMVEIVTRPVANQFKDDLHNGGAKRGTCNKTFGSLRQYWDFMLNRGHVEGVNPWAGVSVLKIEAKGTENPAIREYSDDELRSILAAAKDQDIHDAMMFAALTGARRGELFTLTVADCDRGMMFLKGTKNETSVRIIPVHSALRPVVERLSMDRTPADFLLKDSLDGSRAKKPGDAFGKRFGRHKDGVLGDDPTLNYHSFRHWTAMKMRYAGIADAIISDILGHEHQGTTNKIYAAVMGKARTVNSLDRMSDDELQKLQEFLTPAIEAIKLPDAVKA